MSIPYPLSEKHVALDSNFKKKTVLTDLNKDYFKQLKERESDYLLIDFIDERFALYKIGLSFVTRSSYFVEAGSIYYQNGKKPVFGLSAKS
jgi:hypothetical protein